MTNSFFGLTLASELAKVEKDSKDYRGLVLKLEEAAKDDNETIERFQQLNNGLTRQVAELTAKLESLKQDLKESKIWITQLEESNKTQADLLGEQQSAITKALDEASQAAMLRNEATIEITALKLENKRYRETVQMAIDNLALGIK
jgi:chromosome segregation ATPase